MYLFSGRHSRALFQRNANLHADTRSTIFYGDYRPVAIHTSTTEGKSNLRRCRLAAHSNGCKLFELSHPEPITGCMPREDALLAYAANVNQPGMLFSLDSALPGRLEQMREHLHDPVAADEALALNDVLHRRRRWVDMMAWLHEPTVPWEEHFIREADRAREADRKLKEYLRRQDEKWASGTLPSPLLALGWSPEEIVEFERTEIEDAKLRYLERAKPCPRCGTPVQCLEWFRYVSPPSSRTVFSGWKTRCRSCTQEVDYFRGGMIGTRRWREIPT